MTAMDCGEVRDLLTAYHDDELPFDERRSVGEHLVNCAECRAALDDMKSLSERMRAAGTHALPAGLELRVMARLGVEDRRRAPWTRRLALGASHLAAAALGAVVLYGAMTRIDVTDRAVRDVIAAHTRAMMGDQLIQVASSDSHTVRPWFAGHIPFAPPVKDVAPAEFPLLGGRVDYLEGQPAAVEIYGRRKHRINLFAQPAEATKLPAEIDAARNGYALIGWREGDFVYLAISDIGQSELREFVRLQRSQAP